LSDFWGAAYKPDVPTGIDGKEYKITHKISEQKIPVTKTKILEKDEIEGVYILKTCENSRFKIQIEKKKSDYLYSIFDKDKTILNGSVLINKTQIKLGKIVGFLSKNKIAIQNYVDSNTKASNFTQCTEKNLNFDKE
jgi:hypothetical protein